MDRAAAFALLNEYVKDPGLVRHMRAVEIAMRAYAKKHGGDEELWGIVGLLHDFDYERWPDAPDHPLKGSEILRANGYPEEVIYAILSHADYLPDYPRVHLVDKALYACDELAGFLTACAYVRPSKSILDLEVDSVKRRMKDKAFAKGVNRDDVRKGAEELGVPLEEHIAFCIAAMREQADALGLRGTIVTQTAST